MALAAATKTRLQQVYKGAVCGSKAFVPISQYDLYLILIANDAGDEVAASLVAPIVLPTIYNGAIASTGN